MEDKITTIQLKESTKQKLGSLGNKNDTYDDILVKLLKVSK